MEPKILIKSEDGTSWNTEVVWADTGQPIPGIKKINWQIEADQLGNAKVELEFCEIAIEALAEDCNLTAEEVAVLRKLSEKQAAKNEN